MRSWAGIARVRRLLGDGTALGTLLHFAMFTTFFFWHPLLPLIDWSNHLALIAMFLRKLLEGDVACIEWGLIPGPYFAFYAVSALFAWILGSVEAGAKLALASAFAALMPACAVLCRAAGRSPALAVVAPLAGLGFAFGYGFASFGFSLPVLVSCIALLTQFLTRDEARYHRVLSWVGLPLLLICHGVSFAAFGLYAGPAVVLRSVWGRSWRWIGYGTAIAAPSVLAAVVMLLVAGPSSPAPGGSTGWAKFRPWAERWNDWRGDLLDRGDMGSGWVMLGLGVLASLLLVWGLVHAIRTRSAPSWWGALPAACFSAVHVWGPETIWVPMEVWKISTRFGAVAAALAFMALPVRKLPTVVSALVMASGLSLTALEFRSIHEPYKHFNAAAAPYAQVRALVPKNVDSVLGWNSYRELPYHRRHPAMTSLYFYHVVDGVGFSPYVFDSPLLPVHLSASCPVTRKALFQGGPERALPEVIVVSGASLRSRIPSPYEEVGEHQGWRVFRLGASGKPRLLDPSEVRERSSLDGPGSVE